jgi:BMFP domain-containing protein YqiC
VKIMSAGNRLVDDLSRVAGGALGALGGLRGEVEVLVRQRLEKLISGMDLVTREEFDAVQAMASEARARQEDLEKRQEDLEKKVADLEERLHEKATPKARSAAKKGEHPDGDA